MLFNYFNNRSWYTVLLATVFYSTFPIFFGCGGGTYGTGSSRQEVIIKVVKATQSKNTAGQLQIAGVEGTVSATSQKENSQEFEFRAKVNPEVPISLARVRFAESKYQDFYFETDVALSAGEITISYDTSSLFKTPDTQQGKLECQAILDSWLYVVTTETSDFTSEQIRLMREKIADEALNCNQRERAIAEIAFLE